MPSWDSPGSYSWAVPEDTIAVDFVLEGGPGGDASADSNPAVDITTAFGGGAATVTARVPASDLPDFLAIHVGGSGAPGVGGSNGGGSGSTYDTDNLASGGGGGATEIENGGDGTRLLVAAGGGGGGAARGGSTDAGSGAVGGTPAGADGSDAASGDTTASGGSGGSSSLGSKGGGGGAANENFEGEYAVGGGGGAGATGGGGGGAAVDEVSAEDAAGAGGGSGGSYVMSAATSSSYGTSFSGEYAEAIPVTPTASNLSAPYVGAQETDLDWDGSGADEFEIERDGSVIDTTTNTSYTDTTFTQNTVHTYQVFAVTAGSREDSTNTLDVTTGGPVTSSSLLIDGDYQFSLSAGVPAGDLSEIRLYRRHYSQSYSQIDSSTNPTAYSYTDAVALDGTQYEYEFRAVYPRSGETSGVQETAPTTPLPAPDNLSVGSFDATSIELDSWTVNANSNTQRVEYRTTDSSFWQTFSTGLSLSTTSEVVDSLWNGEEYALRVVTVTPDTTSPSSEVTATTTLPDEDQPVLGNGVEDEVHVDRESEVTNDGFAVMQIRETGESSWDSNATGFAEFSVSHSTLTHNFTNREDGEEYEVRIRTRTLHRAGAWTTPVSIVTDFPGVQNVQIASVGSTSVDIQFDDVSDNEDGVRVWRRQREGVSWGEWQQIDDIGPYSSDDQTITYTDDSTHPGREYGWYLEPYTDDTSSESSIVTTTTDSLGLPRRPVESRGWHVEVLRDDGRVVHPTTLENTNWIPRTNDLPKVRVPVEKSERWAFDEYEEVSVRVWKDGRLTAIEELENVIEHENRVVLEARGGLELLGRTQSSFVDVPAHTAAEQVINNDTSYTPNVDDPAAGTTTDALIQSGDSQNELLNQIESGFADDFPLEISDGAISTQPVVWENEGEDADGLNETVIDDAYSGVTFSGGFAGSLTESGGDDNLQITVSPQHDIPADELKAAARIHVPDGGHPGFDVEIEGGQFGQGVTMQSVPADLFSNRDPDWYEFAGGNPSMLEAGRSYGIEIRTAEPSSANNPELNIDVMAARDQRHSEDANNWSNTVEVSNGTETMEDPDLYPDSVQFETTIVNTTRNVNAVEFTGDFNDTGGPLTIELSPDNGGTWPVSGSNTDTVSGSFTNTTTTSVKARVTMGATGTNGSDTPTTGFQEQSMESFQIYADLDDTPILTNHSFDGQTLSVLQRIADFGNFVFEVRNDNDGDTYVEWTQPGQRSGSLDGTVGEYEVEKNTERSYERVVIKGSSLRIRGESFTSNHDNSVNLGRDSLVGGSEVVYNPNDGTQFEYGVDYEMDYLNGTITVLSTGNMSDSTDYEADYRYKAKGVYTVQGTGSNPKTYVDTIPNLSTEQACESAALFVAKQVQEPRHTAQLTIDDIDPDTSMVANLSLPGELQKTGTSVPEEITSQKESAVVKLGTRETTGEIISRMKRTVSGTAEQV